VTEKVIRYTLGISLVCFAIFRWNYLPAVGFFLLVLCIAFYVVGAILGEIRPSTRTG